MKDISFYGEGMTVDEISGNKLVMRPNMVFECTLGEGFKLEGFKLESLTSEIKKYRSPASTISKVQNFMNSRVPDSIQIPEDTLLKDDADHLDWGIVRHVMNYCNKFMSHFQKFFDHLHL